MKVLDYGAERKWQGLSALSVPLLPKPQALVNYGRQRLFLWSVPGCCRLARSTLYAGVGGRLNRLGSTQPTFHLSHMSGSCRPRVYMGQIRCATSFFSESTSQLPTATSHHRQGLPVLETCRFCCL